LAAQQGPLLADLLTAVGLLEDLLFVVHVEAPPGGLGNYVGIGCQQLRGGRAANNRCCGTDPSESLGLAHGACTTKNRSLLEERRFMLWIFLPSTLVQVRADVSFILAQRIYARINSE
jgi:hypothetical protein